METKEKPKRAKKVEKVKTYKTVEETFNAKHEAARKFIESVDLSQIIALHPPKNS
ncbi:hypothetical protein [Emticicia agri]|uniref:hypothetical protein n=1 Tax=Emticicia agri TaxID=2492393 RepID=UPI0013ED2BD8|nr:hypothetical protein [Emticicia agri]